MHLLHCTFYRFPEFLRQFHGAPPAQLMIEETARRDFTGQHFFQAHGFTAELQHIRIVFLVPAPFVLHGAYGPGTAVPVQDGTALCLPTFHHVALPGHAQSGRSDAEPPHDEKARPFFQKIRVMRPAVHGLPFRSEPVFFPLLFEMNERPLSPAENEVLNAGNHQVLVFCIAHTFRSQVTPAGSCSVSTVTS